MRTLSLCAVAACATSPAPPASAPEAVRAAPTPERAPAPEFALPDLDGAVHRLRDLRGRVVVLEWTSPLCPAVAAVHEPWRVADTIAALDDEDVAWLQVDSSWFAAERKGAARRWRDRLGLDVPFLLDPDGEVGRSYEAECTPTFVVVDPEGRVAWRGPLQDGAWEPERRNLVLEAVRALLAGGEPPGGTPSERGCSVKYGPPRAGLTATDYDEEAAARALYEHAAAATSPEAALELLEQSFEAGLSRPTRVLADPAFATLARDGEARRALHRMLAPRPARGALTMVTPAEPGRPFVLCGTVRDAAGEPIPGAVVSLYHTDAAGWYSAGDTTGENPRLAGRVAADARGRWRVRTILPERYADSGEGLRHVHMQFQAEGFRSLRGQAASVYFEDDPNLRGAALREIRGDGCAILARRPNAEGVESCVHDVVLRR